MANEIILLKHVTKIYDEHGAAPVTALDDVSIRIEKGEFVVLQGPSGCGKTTLLNMIGLIDVPTSGKIIIGGVDTSGMKSGKLSKLRQNAGYVFQFYNLLNELSIVDNVSIPLAAKGVASSRKRNVKALEKLGIVNLSGTEQRLPSELSGGQQQRAAIARGLVVEPSIIIADEPTGSLDSKTRDGIIELIEQLNAEFGHTILLVTHDPDVAKHGKRHVHMIDGKIVSDDGIDVQNATIENIDDVELPSRVLEEKVIDPQIIKIKELLDVSDRIKINDISEALGMKRKELFNKIVSLSKMVKFQISDDVIIVGKDKADVFISELDKQFAEWGKKSTKI